MKCKLLCLALLGTLPSVAHAQDAGSAPSSPWSFALKIGQADLNDPEFVALESSEPYVEDVAFKTETKNVLAIAGELSRNFGPVRVGLEIGYHRTKVAGLNITRLQGEPVTPQDIQEIAEDCFADGLELDGSTIRASSGSVATLARLSVMANVAYELPVSEVVHPYVGAGAGIVGSHLNVVFEGDGGAVGFAWQLLAGATFKLGTNFDLGAEYTYRRNDAMTFQLIEDDASDVKLSKVSASIVSLVARVRF